jgi:SAM-dependent methyltransferase
MSGSAVERVREKLAESGRRNVDLRTWEIGARGLPPYQSKFDVIVLSHVLEHVPDDARLLSEVYEALVPGGTLIVMVPLEQLTDRISSGHVRAYDEAVARRGLDRAGFSIRGVEADHSIDNVSRWLAHNSFLKRAPALQSRLLGLLSIVCTLLVGIERLSWFGPERNLILVAQRG